MKSIEIHLLVIIAIVDISQAISECGFEDDYGICVKSNRCPAQKRKNLSHVATSSGNAYKLPKHCVGPLDVCCEVSTEPVRPCPGRCATYCFNEWTEKIDINGNPSKGLCDSQTKKCCVKADDRQVRPDSTISTFHKSRGENEGTNRDAMKCGYRNQEGIGFRILAGSQETEFGEFPWTVAILKEVEHTDEILINVYQCGGSLIHPKVVLTVAHCIQTYKSTPEKLKIRAGEWDTQSRNELLDHQERVVEEIVVHANYNSKTLYNDIGLLFLCEPIDTIHEHIQPVCLPPLFHNFDYSQCFATGWGKDAFGTEGKYQLIMKKVQLPIVPQSTCQSALRTQLGARFLLHSSFICAGGEKGKDTCKGDGGSPLVCPIPESNGQYYQAGIVSWGVRCGEESIPGVYVNTAAFRYWIDLQLELRQIDKTSYQYSL